MSCECQVSNQKRREKKAACNYAYDYAISISHRFLRLLLMRMRIETEAILDMTVTHLSKSYLIAWFKKDKLDLANVSLLSSVKG